jgi:hypothetical protein
MASQRTCLTNSKRRRNRARELTSEKLLLFNWLNPKAGSYETKDLIFPKMQEKLPPPMLIIHKVQPQGSQSK